MLPTEPFFKKKFLPLTAVITTLTLIGCGSSNSSVDTGTTTELSGLTVSGQVADGYLNEAVVCLDLNLNKVCDTGEPSTTSGVDEDGNPGTYTLEITDDSIDPTLYPVIVEIVAGVTVDMDNPDTTVATSSTLSSPPGKPEFISPLTTLVHSKIEANPSFSIEDAEQSVITDLGFDASTGVNLFEDYVQEQGDNAKDPTKKELFKKLHNVGRVVTAIMGSQNGTNQTTFDNTDDRAALQLLMLERISQQLADIITLLSDTTNLDTDGKISVASLDFTSNTNPFKTGINDKINVSADEVLKKKTDLKSLETITKVNLLEILQGNGVFFIEEKDKYSKEEGADYAYSNFKVSANGASSESQFFWDGTAFVEAETEEENNYFLLTANGFIAGSEIVETARAESDGRLIFMRNGVDYEEITASKRPIAGEPINQFLAGFADEWVSRIPGDAKFAAGSIAIRGVSKKLTAEYELHAWYECEAEQADASGNCNVINSTDGQQASALTDIVYDSLTELETNIDMLSTRIYVGHNLEAALYTDGVTTKAAFIARTESTEGTTAATHKIIGTATVESKTVLNTPILFISYATLNPDVRIKLHGDDNRANGLFFAVDGDLVRKGEYYAAGAIEEDKDWILNKASIDSITTAFDPNGAKFLTSIASLKTDISAATLKTNGVFEDGIFGTEVDFFYDDATQTERAEHFIFEVTIDTSNNIVDTDYAYDTASGLFAAEESSESDSDRNLIYVAGDWVAESDDQKAVFETDGSMTITDASGTELESITFTQVDLSNKLIRDFGPFMGEFALSINREAKFAAGDKGYFINIKPVGTQYSLYNHDGDSNCDGTEAICNFVRSFDPSTGSETLIETIADLEGTNVRVYLDWGLYALINSAGTEATIYKDYGFGEESEMVETVTLVVDGDITKIPFETEHDNGTFITEYESYVRVGHYREAANSEGHHEFMLDSEAIETVKSNFILKK